MIVLCLHDFAVEIGKSALHGRRCIAQNGPIPDVRRKARVASYLLNWFQKELLIQGSMTSGQPLKEASQIIGRVDAFKGFVMDIPDAVDIDNHTTVAVWCETFEEFVLVAQYR